MPRLRICILTLIVVVAVSLATVPYALAQGPALTVSADQRLEPLLAALPDASYADKRALIRQLVALRDPRVRAVLQALLDGNLYVRSSDQRIFIAQPEGDNLRLEDPVSSASAGTACATSCPTQGNAMQGQAQICKGDAECQNKMQCIPQTCLDGANLDLCGLTSQAPFMCTAAQ